MRLDAFKSAVSIHSVKCPNRADHLDPYAEALETLPVSNPTPALCNTFLRNELLPAPVTNHHSLKERA
jgi:hypothetical protein